MIDPMPQLIDAHARLLFRHAYATKRRRKTFTIKPRQCRGRARPVAGLRVLHLQCHFGADTLSLAQRGATVVGLDFSPRAIAAARMLQEKTGLEAEVVTRTRAASITPTSTRSSRTSASSSPQNSTPRSTAAIPTTSPFRAIAST